MNPTATLCWLRAYEGMLRGWDGAQTARDLAAHKAADELAAFIDNEFRPACEGLTEQRCTILEEVTQAIKTTIEAQIQSRMIAGDDSFVQAEKAEALQILCKCLLQRLAALAATSPEDAIMAAPSIPAPSTQDDGRLTASYEGAAASFTRVTTANPLPSDLKVGDEVAFKMTELAVPVAALRSDITAYRRATAEEKKDD